MVSMRQLARLAGVSPGLVSRVLNHDPTLAVPRRPGSAFRISPRSTTTSPVNGAPGKSGSIHCA